MSKNNQAATHQTIYEDIKKFDVNALRAFLYANTKDVTDALDYWGRRRISLIKVKDQENQLALIDLEIMKLESILLAKTEFTLDFFKIADIPTIQSNSETLSIERRHFDKNFPSVTGIKDELPIQESKKEKKHWGYKTLENLVKDKVSSHLTDLTIKSQIGNILIGNVVDLGDGKLIEITNEEEFNKYFETNFASLLESETPVVQMIPQQIKQSVLAEHCKRLLTEDKRTEAFDFAKGYLANATYIPTKENKKPEKWHDARINSWLDDLAKNIKPTEKSKNPTPAVEESQENKPGTEQATAANATSIVQDGENANQETDEESVDLSVTIEHYDKFCDWLKSKNRSIEDVIDAEAFEELKNPANRSKYGSVVFEINKKDADAIIAELSSLGIDSVLVTDESFEETSKPFENASITLSEEIEHIDNLLTQCHELRGSEKGKPENMDKVEELISLFYGTRNKEYKDKKELIKVLKDRPDIMKNSKDFFSFMCPEKLEALKEGKETNLYRKIVDEIKAHAFDKEEDLENNFLPKIVKKLQHKILMGMTSDGKNIVNKNMFYTIYHILFFVDQIIANAREEAKTSQSGEAVATPATTIPVGTESEKQIETEKSQSDNKKSNSEIVDTILLSLVKSGGIVSDALLHPTIVEMKGKEFADPWEAGILTLNDENYEKFVTKKFEEIAETYRSTLTEFPASEMIRMITSAHIAGVSAEEYVKEAIEHLRKKDDTFLPIKGKLEDVEVNVLIKVEADLLAYIKEVYDIQDKALAEQEAERNKYPESEFKTYLEFETAVKAQASEHKMPIEELKVWVKEKIMDKRFSEEKNMDKPMFKSDHPENLDNWLDIITRKAYETPESRQKREEELANYIGTEAAKSELTFISFLHVIKSYCNEKKIDTDLKTLRAKALEIIKEKNKVMYDKYMNTLKDLQKSGMLATKVETPPALKGKTEEKKVVITSEADKNPVDDSVLTITTEADLVNLLTDKFNKKEYQVNVLKALKSVVCDKKQITDMQLSEAQLNEWVNKFYDRNLPSAITKTKSAQKTEETELDTPTETRINFVPDMIKEKEFEDLSNANDKHPFKTALNRLISKFEDSSELRSAIVNSINNGKGKHTIKVAKQDVSEHHKMIKKAFENYNEGKLK